MEVQLKRPTPGNASPAQLNNQLKDGMQEQNVVMMSCKALPGMSMTVKDGAVRFARSSETDANQQWVIADSSGHKDAKGKPEREAFAIVNLGTWMAIKIPDEAEQPVGLVPYIPNPLDPDTSLLWTAEDTQNGEYKIIREYKDRIRKLVLAAAVHQGLQVVASKHNGGNSQLWSIQKRI